MSLRDREDGQVATKRRVFLETFGCQMNILDSELVGGQLTKAGHRLVDKADQADVVLMNTCSVRDLSEQKVLSRLGKLKERKEKGEDLVIGILGCMAERAHDELAKAKPFIDLMVGPSKIRDTLNLLESAINKDGGKKTRKSLSYFVNRKGIDPVLSPFDDLEAMDRMRPIDDKKRPWQAYVRITRGCNKFCSFCVVPRTRGPEVHRPPQSIIDEVKRLTDNGAIEITLLGQTINHYCFQDSGKRWSFADLLFNVHEQVPHLQRLRFLTSYPRDFTDDALDVMRDSERISKYLHIPAQSGSDRVLKTMNRGYDIETYLSLIERARQRMPSISLVGDMIVGFPNETDEDFSQSLDLLRRVRFKNVFVFKYSKRPNTVAFKKLIDNVPEEIKKERNNAMLSLQNQIAHEHHQAMVGQPYKVLCEGLAKIERQKGEINLAGRTTGDHIVHFRGSEEMIGTLIDIRVTKARELSLDGVIV